MESFVVSARKYRPIGFEEVVGQGHITTTLENAIKSNHLGQALLFCGPRGVGKTTCARILAKTINEFNTETGESNNNFNIFELDAASNNSVDDIRNLIDQVRYPPQQGKYKVYIIDEVHMLSTQAFNAFLKTLEEPPAYAIFILATTEKHKVIPTILSRCQIYDFNRIEVKDILAQLHKIALSEGVDTEEEALHLIAQKADGALRDALSIFDMITTFSADGKITYQDVLRNLHMLDYDYYFQIVDLLLAENMSGALMLFDKILKNGFDGNNFLSGFQQHLRNLLVAKDPQTIELLEAADKTKEQYLAQAKRASPSFLLSALNISNQFELNYKQSKNQRLHVELCLMKLAHLPNALSLSSIENEAKKKRISHDAEGEMETEKVTKVDVAEKPEPKEKKPDNSPVLPETPPVASNQRIPTQPNSRTETPSIFNRKKLRLEGKKNTLDKKEEPFTEKDLQNSWKAFGENWKNISDTDKLILNRTIKKGKGHVVVLELASQLEVSFVEKREVDLVQFLISDLKNDHIVLRKEVIKEQNDNKKLYTSKDIYEYMVKENPHLQELKDRLGLDFDY